MGCSGQEQMAQLTPRLLEDVLKKVLTYTRHLTKYKKVSSSWLGNGGRIISLICTRDLFAKRHFVTRVTKVRWIFDCSPGFIYTVHPHACFTVFTCKEICLVNPCVQSQVLQKMLVPLQNSCAVSRNICKEQSRQSWQSGSLLWERHHIEEGHHLCDGAAKVTEGYCLLVQSGRPLCAKLFGWPVKAIQIDGNSRPVRGLFPSRLFDLKSPTPEISEALAITKKMVKPATRVASLDISWRCQKP